MPESQRTLRVFLCHSSSDKQIVRDLYWRLRSDGLDPWLDEENLLPGQDWNSEIEKAVRNTDVVIVFLSKESVNKTGFVQKEVKYALDVADEQPDGTIFLIPLKLEECNVPERLRRWHWVNLFDEKGYERLMKALHQRADSLRLNLRNIDIVKLGEYRPSHLAAAILQVESLFRSDLIRLGIQLEIAVDPRIFIDVTLNALTYSLAEFTSTRESGTCVTLHLPKFQGDAAPNNSFNPTPP